jgi:uncharacterized membrane protein
MSERPRRRGYLDWMRGLAVVIMVGWHTLDSWTTPAAKATGAFWYCMLIGGFGAPIFLFLAGVSVALASASRLRRADVGHTSGVSRADVGHTSGVRRADVGHTSGVRPTSTLAAAWPMVKRGAWIWVLAILFRLQSDVLGGRTSLYQLVTFDIIRGNTLKVDILNVMGPAIAGAAAAWGLARTATGRLTVAVVVAALFAFATPSIRAWTALDALPDAIEGYLRPFAGRTTFSLFPWAGFVFAGSAIGVLIDRARDAAAERRLIVQFAIGGLALWAIALVSASLPSLLGPTDFWRTAPSFFFVRVGVLVAGIAACYAWEARPRLFGADAFSPMRQLGVTSLFIYWIHVEMAYGGLSKPIRGQLSLPIAIVAFLLFMVAMLGLSVAKTKIAERWRARQTTG